MVTDGIGQEVEQPGLGLEPHLLPVFDQIPWASYRVVAEGHEHIVFVRRYPSPISQQDLLGMAPSDAAREPGITVFATNVAHCREATSVETVSELRSLSKYAYAADTAASDTGKYVEQAGGWQKMLDLHKQAAQHLLKQEYLGEAAWGQYRILLFRTPGSSALLSVYRKGSNGRYYVMNRWPEDLSLMLRNGRLMQLFQPGLPAEDGASAVKNTAGQR
jgi:hypothetical protein